MHCRLDPAWLAIVIGFGKLASTPQIQLVHSTPPQIKKVCTCIEPLGLRTSGKNVCSDRRLKTAFKLISNHLSEMQLEMKNIFKIYMIQDRVQWNTKRWINSNQTSQITLWENIRRSKKFEGDNLIDLHPARGWPNARDSARQLAACLMASTSSSTMTCLLASTSSFSMVSCTGLWLSWRNAVRHTFINKVSKKYDETRWCGGVGDCGFDGKRTYAHSRHLHLLATWLNLNPLEPKMPFLFLLWPLFLWLANRVFTSNFL